MKELWKGNHAIAEAAMRAGCMFYAGYPITPQTEVGEYLSGRMPELGRKFIQAENEMAACYMLQGAGSTGMRCMTSSSGPGFALKQEAIGYLCSNWIPTVFVNVIRWGPGLGSLDSAQTDYFQATRGGGNGDYRLPVFAPNSIQETIDLMYEAWDMAEKYRNPVMILSEASLGQMMEAVEFPEFKEGPKQSEMDWVWNGVGDRHSFNHGTPLYVDKPRRVREKIETMQENEQRWESYLVEDADYVCVAYGLPSRTTREAVDQLRAEGIKVGLIRPIMVWPFPFKAFAEIKKDVKGIISIETTDAGQVVEDVALATKKMVDGNVPVYGLYTAQKVVRPSEAVAFIKRVIAGEEKEVF